MFEIKKKREFFVQFPIARVIGKMLNSGDRLNYQYNNCTLYIL